MELIVYREFALLEPMAEAAGVKMVLPEISVMGDEAKERELKQRQVLLYLLNHKEEGVREEDMVPVECAFNEDGVQQCRGILESEMALKRLAENGWNAMVALEKPEEMVEEVVEELSVAEDGMSLEYQNELRARLETADLKLEELKRHPLLDEKIEVILVILDDCFIVNRQETAYTSEQAEREVRKVEAMVRRYQSRIEVLQEKAERRQLYRGQMLRDFEEVRSKYPELELRTDNAEKAQLYFRGREVAEFEFEEGEMARFERRLQRMEGELSKAE